MVQTIYLVRHGRTEYNAQKRIQGLLNPALDDRGLAQANKLREWFGTKKVDRVLASPARRAQATALIAFTGKTVQTVDAFAERDYGLVEGVKWETARKAYPKAFERWDTDRELVGIGAENMEQIRARLEKGLETLWAIHEDSVAVVAHGLINRTLLSLITKTPISAHATEKFPPASVIELRQRENVWTIEQIYKAEPNGESYT